MAILLSTTAPASSRTMTLILKVHRSIRFLHCTGLKDQNFKKKDSYVALSINGSLSTTRTINDSNHGKKSRKRYNKQQPLLSEARDYDANSGLVCPGCGVFMQDDDPTLPGYYQKKKVEVTYVSEDEFVVDDIDGELEDGDVGGGELDSKDDDEGTGVLGIKDEFDWDSDWASDFEDDEDDLSRELDGFTAAGVGYGNITEEVLEKGKKKRVSKSERKRLAREAQVEKEEVTVCARCHSLRNYGQVKNQTAENLIPDFDFDKLISTRLMKPTGNADSTVVIMVVDCVDFDGCNHGC